MEKRIKIIQFIPSFGVGGAENIAKHYCKSINRKEFDVLVIAVFNSHSYHDDDLAKSGVKVIYLNEIIDKKYHMFPAIFRRIIRRIVRPLYFRRVLKKFRPDIIHYHLPCSRLILKARPDKNVKIFLTVHSEPNYFWGKDSQWKDDYISTVKLANAYSFVFIVLHDEMKHSIDEVWFKNVDHDTIIMRNGIDMSAFENIPPREVIINELKIPSDNIVIGHVGSFVEVKNHVYLIDVFYELKKFFPCSTLVLVGDGAKKNIIQKKVHDLKLDDSVLFLGIRNDTPKILSTFDVFVFPSLTEGISLALIEAQVCGIKCVVSDKVPKFNEISNNLLKFLSLTDMSPSEWAEEILKVNKDDGEYSCDTYLWDIQVITRALEKEYLKRIN